MGEHYIRTDVGSLKDLPWPFDVVNIEDITSTNELQLNPGNCEVAINKTSGFLNYALQINGCEAGADSNLMTFSTHDNISRIGIYLENDSNLVVASDISGKVIEVDDATGQVIFEDSAKTPVLTVDNIITDLDTDLIIQPGGIGKVSIDGTVDPVYSLTVGSGVKIEDIGIQFHNPGVLVGGDTTQLSYYEEIKGRIRFNTTSYGVVGGSCRIVRIGYIVCMYIRGYDNPGFTKTGVGSIDVDFLDFGSDPDLPGRFRPEFNVSFPFMNRINPSPTDMIEIRSDGGATVFSDFNETPYGAAAGLRFRNQCITWNLIR